MRSHRYAIAGVAIVASTILISCGSDDDDSPVDSAVPVVSNSTISSLPIAETTVDVSTDTTLP
jgi:hypothetical protein